MLQTAIERPRVPLIKFPERTPLDQRFPLLETLKTMVIPKREEQKVIEKDDGVVLQSLSELPPRFRRQEISEEEIAYIERGGPE